eukprot:c12271_g1_i1.p1 GENE.c12271_g1_i1~~c12271_g1_i1.p1  ORF type:complete len:116 (+),score=11.13 c12271_g1_i1:357-704(+)
MNKQSKYRQNNIKKKQEKTFQNNHAIASCSPPISVDNSICISIITCCFVWCSELVRNFPHTHIHTVAQASRFVFEMDLNQAKSSSNEGMQSRLPMLASSISCAQPGSGSCAATRW